MANNSPITPNKARRSFCPSEYDTAGEEDISDSSLYYSIVDEDNISMNVNKENVTNSGPWSVSDAPAGHRMPKGATPLLRKILQSNSTPRNKHNKRVSFSHSPKSSPVPAMADKLAKIQINETNGSNGKKRVPLTPGKVLKTQSLIKISETVEGEASSVTALTVDNVAQHSIEEEPAQTIEETLESIEMGDCALDITASTDDIEKDQLHNTIIENLVDEGDQTLITLDTVTSVPEELINQKPADEIMASVPPKTAVAPVTNQANIAKQAAAAILENGRKKSMIPSTIAPPNTPSKFVSLNAEELLKKNEVKSPAQANTKNAAKLNRMKLATDTRKSILPVAKKPSRPTVYKRRSGTFETRKVDRRGTLARMSMAKTAATKTVPPPKATAPKTAPPKPETSKVAPNPSKATTKPSAAMKPPTTAKPSTATSSTTESSNIVVSSAVRDVSAKPRMSTRYSSVRLSIYTTRQTTTTTITNAQRAQQRQTRNFGSLTTQSVNPSVPSTSASTSSASTAKKETFARPIIPRLLNGKAAESKLPVANPTFKCRYCDRTFAKNFGLDQHLMENCEKIPASQRRLLLKNQTDQAESKTRKHDSDYHFTHRQNETWKHSRFFVEKINQANSNGDTDANQVEAGLSSLRKDLKILSNAHSGVTRTPKKAIKCHICDKLFWDCVEYAVHNSNHAAEQS